MPKAHHAVRHTTPKAHYAERHIASQDKSLAARQTKAPQMLVIRGELYG